jgi:hypothetical protein
MSQEAINSMLSRRSLCAAAVLGIGMDQVAAENIGAAEAVKAMEIA